MSSFIIHLLVPPLMAASLHYFRLRHIWAWVWVSVLVDIDYLGWILYDQGILAVNTHRALFHNIWWLVLGVAGGVFAFRQYRLGFAGTTRHALHAWAHTFRGSGWMLGSFYYFSHLLLDSFQGGVALLFPLGLFVRGLDFTLAFDFEILVDTTTQEPFVEAEASAPPGVVDVSEVYRWLSSEETAFLLLFAAVLLLGRIYRAYAEPVRVVRAVRAEAPEAPGSHRPHNGP
ncbi:MAG: hypothetical protein HYT80_02925 [Euryarchaeota archaeon]|nr:hypothetical protein [Euryarchaeota archaeon]